MEVHRRCSITLRLSASYRDAPLRSPIPLPAAFDRDNLKLAGFGFQGVARLKPGVNIAQANADVVRMVPIWMDSWSTGPGTNPHF